MNLQIIYQLEDETGVFLFEQQLRICFAYSSRVRDKAD